MVTPTWKPHEKRGHLTERSDLPDSVFAFPTERKEPLTDAMHVRNAITRFDQVSGVTDAQRALAFANIKQAAQYFGLRVNETDWRQLGCHPHTGRTAGEKRASSRAGVQTKRVRDELSKAARKVVETKRKTGALTEEARKAVATKRARREL